MTEPRRSRECLLCGHRYIPYVSLCWCSLRIEDDADLRYHAARRGRLRLWWARVRFRRLIPLWTRIDTLVSTILYQEVK